MTFTSLKVFLLSDLIPIIWMCGVMIACLKVCTCNQSQKLKLIFHLVDHYFILCNSNNSAKPGKDECIPCSHNTFNPNKNDTSTVPYQVPEYVVCKKPNCDCTPEGEYNKNLWLKPEIILLT